MEPRPTINDVADRAGVSKSLVSRVMRDQPHVSPARRAAVLEAAESLGYRPNAAARSLVARRSQAIGVLVGDRHNPTYNEVLDGIDACLETQSFTKIMVSGEAANSRGRQAVETLLELQVEGLILIGHLLTNQDIARFAEERPTVVVGDHDVSDAAADTICNEDATGARIAVEHLTSLGHRRITHLAGGRSAAALERRRGYEEAMRSTGLADHIDVVSGGFSDDDGHRAAVAALESGRPPSALFVANDFAALGAMAAIEQAGLRVASDVSIVGYDGIALSGMRRIMLTTIAQPLTEMGAIAAEMLFERIESQRSTPRRERLDPRLIVRDSTAPVRSDEPS